MDILVDSFMRLRAEAKARMSEEEFQQAEEKFDEIVNQVRARKRLQRNGKLKSGMNRRGNVSKKK